MARYRIDHFVRVLIMDQYENIVDTFIFRCVSEATEFMENYPLGNDAWKYEFVYQRGNSLESLVEESTSEDGEYYENGVRVPEELLM